MKRLLYTEHVSCLHETWHLKLALQRLSVLSGFARSHFTTLFSSSWKAATPPPEYCTISIHIFFWGGGLLQTLALTNKAGWGLLDTHTWQMTDAAKTYFVGNRKELNCNLTIRKQLWSLKGKSFSLHLLDLSKPLMKKHQSRSIFICLTPRGNENILFNLRNYTAVTD